MVLYWGFFDSNCSWSGFIHACSCFSSKIMSAGDGNNSFCNPYVHFKWRKCCGGAGGCWSDPVVGVTKDSFDNLAFLIILCNLSSLLPLPLIGLLLQI